MLSFYGLGTITGAIATASVLLLIGLQLRFVPIEVRLVLLALVAGVMMMRDLRIFEFPLPQNGRQIPQRVLKKGVMRGAFQFGLELGSGVRTYVTTSSPYVLAAAVVLASPQYLSVVLAGVGFGIGRLAPLAWATVEKTVGLPVGSRIWRLWKVPMALGGSIALVAAFAFG